MATLYVKAAGGNASAAATWSNISSLGVDSSGPPSASDDCIADLNSGQLTIDAGTAMKSFSCTDGVGDYPGTITHNAFQLTVSGSVTFVAGMTYTPVNSSATLSIQGNGTLTSAGKLLYRLNVAAGATLTLGDNLSFVAQKDGIVSQSSGVINLNGKTLSGNSATNRLLITGGNIGINNSSITIASGTFANTDFRDVQFVSASNLDLSAITGKSGDCGGNTLTGGGSTLTLTPSATQTYTGGTGSWSDVSKWTSRVPIPQDDVLMSGVTGGTITQDMPRIGRSIDWTGAAGSPTYAELSSSTYYGSLTLISGMTYSPQSITFEGRGSYTLTSAGQTTGGNNVIQMVGGTLTLQDACIFGGSTTLTVGTLNTNGKSFQTTALVASNSNTRVLNIANSSVTLNGTGTIVNFSTTTGLTFTSTGSTILITNTSASSKTLTGGGLTFGKIQISGTGSGAVIITGANTFKSIQVIGGTKSITLPGSTTTTLTGEAGLSNGTNLITFVASAGSATISQATGIVNWDYVSLTNIIGTGGAAFYAGPTTHSTDGGGNTGWIFANPPNTDGGFGNGRFGNSGFGIKRFGVGAFS